MMQIPDYILALIDKYQAGTANDEEKKLLEKWYHSFNDSYATLNLTEQETEEVIADRIKNRLFTTIRSEETPVISMERRRKWTIPAAAAILMLLSLTAYFIFKPVQISQQPVSSIPVKQPVNDIAPGGNKALLTLADGTTIVLDSASNGTISLQGNTKIQKLDNGLLAYEVNGKMLTENDEAFYNTISTPRGGQYQVTLADGTAVWLNAASSIRFPVLFTGNERKVTISGEVYFEVAKNASKPFKVKANNSEIEVLGTHFNVNAYNDEASIKTTLVEGAVKVSAMNQPSRFLQPGQQSRIAGDGKITVLDNADVEEALAWKNGRFQFKSADLKSILRQISRWYDVDVVYQQNVNLHFTGQLTRNEYASKVFEKLALTGEVNFKVDGKKIIVTAAAK